MKKNLLAMQAAIVGQLVLTIKLMLTAFFFCGASVLTSCSDTIDNPVTKNDCRNGTHIRLDLLKDPAQDVGTVCQDWQSVAQCVRVARRQGKGVAAI